MGTTVLVKEITCPQGHEHDYKLTETNLLFDPWKMQYYLAFQCKDFNCGLQKTKIKMALATSLLGYDAKLSLMMSKRS